jgi:nicotinamidase-related amidase
MKSRTALLLVDAQVNMFDPENPVAGAEELLARLTSLLAKARAIRMPVVFIRNCGGLNAPDRRDTPGWEIQPDLAPVGGELVFDKTTRDAFASTGLGEELLKRGIQRVVIAGLQSDHCIRATTLGALGRGLQVTLVSDAHSTYPAGGKLARDISEAINIELEERVKLERTHEVRLP